MSAEFPKIYKINSGSASGYVFARGFGPFEGMAFMDDLPEAYRKVRQDFWQVNPVKPGLTIDRSYGSRWPDVLANHDPPPGAFYSQHVLDWLIANKIRFKRASPVPVTSLPDKKMAATPHPQYYVLQSEPGISIDFEASGLARNADGSPAYNGEQIRSAVLHLDPETWSGEPLFGIRNLARGHFDLLCTQEVKDLAGREKWTNIDFTRQRVKGVDPFA